MGESAADLPLEARDILAELCDGAEKFARLTQGIDAHHVVDALRPLLDAHVHAPEALVEYVAARLGLDSGHRDLGFWLDDGHLRKTKLGHNEIGNRELAALARVD